MSDLTLTLDAPAAASGFRTALYGEAGVIEISGWADAVAAFGVAVDELMEQAGRDQPSHPCDVVFAAEVVRILDAARRSLDSGRAEAV